MLLTACSKDDDKDAEETTTTTTSSATSATSSSAESSSEETTTVTEETTAAEEAPAEQPAPAPAPQNGEQAAEEAQAQMAVQNAINNAKKQTPVQGQAASEKDVQEINAAINSVAQAGTIRQLTDGLLNNVCQPVLDAQGGADVIRAQADALGPVVDQPLPPESRGHVDNVADIMVQGDQASANVTASGGGQTNTEVMRFQKENGTWKICGEI